MRGEVSVETRDGCYPVLVGSGLLAALPELLTRHAPAHRYAVISDDRVASLYGTGALEACRAAGLDAELFGFPPGEASKTRETWSGLTDRMLEEGLGRDCCVVALGGGVTTDLAGFVAATFLRGVPLVQVPTTYLAMLDASVGGKTGVDAAAGKNLVGAFHPPKLVAADPWVLASLPRAERAQGLVEAYKHGAIADADYFEDLVEARETILEAAPEAASRTVLRSVEIKGRIVSQDERERDLRQVLNFGHTVGHALEAASRYAIGHGSAVAVGMIVEARIGERLGVTDEGTADRLAGALRSLLTDLPDGLHAEAVAPFLSADKKARGGRPRFVLLSRIGEVATGEGWCHEVDDSLVMEVVGAWPSL